MSSFVTRVLRDFNGSRTEDYTINDQDLYQTYAIYTIPNHFNLMYEADYIPESNSFSIRYTVLEESPDSKVAKRFHQVAKILEGGLEKFFGIK